MGMDSQTKCNGVEFCQKHLGRGFEAQAFSGGVNLSGSNREGNKSDDRA